MPQWEYCVLYEIVQNRKGWLVCKDLNSGIQRLILDPTNRLFLRPDDTGELSTAICDLGKEGWEMVGVAQLRKGHALYFKRLILH